MTSHARPTGRLTIVTPTYEKHYRQFGEMIRSIGDFCSDADAVTLNVVVEEKNREIFAALCDDVGIDYHIISTEEVLQRFGIDETPGAFLKRVGKFTFQTIKKFGGLLNARTHWSLVLDSEGLFMKPFSAMQLVEDYASRKYVFYTRTAPRGNAWRHSTGFQVTQNAGAALGIAAGDRWYMEYFHWFYESDKFEDLINNKLKPSFFDALRDRSVVPGDYFENILYYLYLETYHQGEYDFVDFKKLLDEMLPPELSRRFSLHELPFSLFGNEYLLNILRPSEIAALQPMFDRYKLPFVRLEPPYFSPEYIAALKALPQFVATISSHHLVWMKKKIAICISGEFRQIIHRTPEHQVRQILGFLSGVDCDIYIHGWSNPSEALIIDQLKPKAYKFEPKPSFSALESRIKLREPNIKQDRDAGSLAMFYGIEAAFNLAKENIQDYDIVVRLRPDIYFDGSLKEIFVAISDEGDFLPKTIYLPRHFHSKGINDQFAIGPSQEMATYAQTFSYIENNIEDLFFNPETILLRNLMEHRIEIAVLEMRYALMRHDPFRIDSMHHHLHHQEHVWWSRTDPLPSFQDVSAYFADKLRSIDGIMRGEIPRVTFLDTRDMDPSHEGALIRCAVVDNDPALATSAFFERARAFTVLPLVLREGHVQRVGQAPPGQTFLFKNGEAFRLSQWTLRNGVLQNEVLDVPASRVSFGRSPHPVRMRMASEWRQFVQRTRIDEAVRYSTRRTMSVLGLAHHRPR